MYESPIHKELILITGPVTPSFTLSLTHSFIHQTPMVSFVPKIYSNTKMREKMSDQSETKASINCSPMWKML